MPLSLGEEIAGKGWCAGTVIPRDLIALLKKHMTRPGEAPAPVGADDWIVVVSQTCDVLAKTIDVEPLVELLQCKPILQLRGQYKELRSTRILDFKPNNDTHSRVVLSAHAVADRYIAPRTFLRDCAPDPDRRLSPVATARVLAWYALRYARPAWPDAFVARLRGANETLKTALIPLQNDIAEVRIGIVEKDQELRATEDYHVAIFFIVDEAIWDGDVEGRRAIHEAFATFAAALGRCAGINVNEDLSRVCSGADFSWQATRASDEWNFDYLTHGE